MPADVKIYIEKGNQSLVMHRFKDGVRHLSCNGQSEVFQSSNC